MIEHPSFVAAQSLSRTVMREMVMDEPRELFHYTSGDGLHGILGSGALRGSNYAFMNDRSELTYGANLLREVLRMRHSQTTVEMERQLCERAMTASTTSDADLYLVCFCEKGDLLSQWRGYGAQGSRYCICFDASLLRRAHDVSPIMTVVYDRDRQVKLLTRLLDIHLEAIHGAEADGWTESATLASAIPCLLGCAMPLLAFFKDASFQEESEWRAVLFLYGNDRSHDIHFASSDGMMKPSLPLLHGPDSRPLPIARVIAGASRSEQQAVKAATLMLRKFGYERTEVVPSRVPLAG